jgi:hypothetical protein
MADPHVILAPLVEPVLPPVPVAASVPTWPLFLLAVAAGVLLIAWLALGWWRRQAPARALRRIARGPDPAQAAQQLARWQQQYRRQAPPQWQQALDQLNFGAPAATGPDTLRRLCREAASFARLP